MNSTFKKTLKLVTIAHVVVLLLVMLGGSFRLLFPEKTDIILPVKFTVVASADVATLAAIIPPDITREKVKVPEKRKKKPAKRKVKVSNKVVDRNRVAVKPRKVLSQKDIEKRLKMGAQFGKKNTAIPDEDTRGYELIKRTFYNAWLPPTKEVAGNAAVEIGFRLGPNGTVGGGSVVKPSGLALMDNSVGRSLSNVKRVGGLPSGFLKRHSGEEIRIVFKVE
jgi:hypothetical protein